MVSPDQKDMFDVLAKQKQHQHQVDRVLKIVLPIMGFLIAVMCANLNQISTLTTIVMAILSLWMVGIKRQSIGIWTTIILIFCLIDNIFSHAGFKPNSFAIQFGTITTFLWITGIGRPYIDRWLMNSDKNKML